MSTDEKLDILWGAEERIYWEISYTTELITRAEGVERRDGVAFLHLLLQCLTELKREKRT